MMEPHKQSVVAAVITLVLLLSTGTTFAEITTKVPNSDVQAITSSPDSSSSAAEESAGPARQPNNATKSDSQGDISATTEPDSSDTNAVTDTQDGHQDSGKLSTQTNSANTTQRPNKGISHQTTEGIPFSVTKNDTKPQLITTENSYSSNDTEINTTETNTKSAHTDITTTEFMPVTLCTTWMDRFISTHHFEGQYMFNGVRYLFDFVARYQHPRDPNTLVTNFYDADGAVLEFNGTSTDGHVIIFTLSTIYTPGVRFPLHQPLEITGSFQKADQPYFTGNVTKPINSSFSWFHMNKGLGVIETGETAGTRTAIVIIIPTSIAFLGICGTIAIVCWASKKGYLRGRHKSYRLFMNAQVSYESEAETIHI